MYMTASRGEGQDPAVPGLWRGWDPRLSRDTPIPVQWGGGGHACPVPPHRGLGGPEVHDGAALHLQAEQRDGRKAFPPAGARSHERGLSPWLVSLPQQGTVGRRGDGHLLAFHQPRRGGEGVAEKWQGGEGRVHVFWGEMLAWGDSHRDAGQGTGACTWMSGERCAVGWGCGRG